MNAKEFLQQEINKTHTRGAAKDPNLFISRKYAVGLMEAYHRAKVEAVTDRQIQKEANKCWLPADFRSGAKYVIDKLLNQ